MQEAQRAREEGERRRQERGHDRRKDRYRDRYRRVSKHFFLYSQNYLPMSDIPFLVNTII